ncbi:hypothetical protein F5Y16DRAFT_394967 [Xylariaceae sp. FL0255]|nr:hypothetical protein F5Y16DRAFT_394967 [Xylariaceae sp. FL0255]
MQLITVSLYLTLLTVAFAQGGYYAPGSGGCQDAKLVGDDQDMSIQAECPQADGTMRNSTISIDLCYNNVEGQLHPDLKSVYAS